MHENTPRLIVYINYGTKSEGVVCLYMFILSVALHQLFYFLLISSSPLAYAMWKFLGDTIYACIHKYIELHSD